MTDNETPSTEPIATSPEPVAEPVKEPEPVIEPEPVKEPEPAAKSPRWDPRIVVAGVLTAVAIVAVLLLVLMVFAPGIAPIKLGAVADAERADREAEVEDVSARFAVALYSFNYKTIDADLERIDDYSTGTFSKELTSVLGEVDVFKDAIVDARGESTGAVEGVDVRDVGDTTATSRVFVVQTIKNKKNPKPRQQFSAVELTLVKTSEGWKVDDVQEFQSGAPQASPIASNGAPATPAD